MANKCAIREGRERRREGQREGQNPCHYWGVKGAKGKTSPAYTYTQHSPRTNHTTHAPSRVYTFAFHAFNDLHKPVVARVSDVKGKFFAFHAFHRVGRMKQKPLGLFGKIPKASAFIVEIMAGGLGRFPLPLVPASFYTVPSPRNIKTGAEHHPRTLLRRTRGEGAVFGIAQNHRGYTKKELQHG